jgi:HEAT repeat protein
VIPRRLQELENDITTGEESIRQSALNELAGSTHAEALSILWRACNAASPLKELAQATFKDAVLAHPATALRHTDLVIRNRSLETAAKHKSVSAVAEIIRLLRNESEPAVRCDAADALGNIGDESGISGLTLAVQDQSLQVRESVLRALSKITHASSKQVIVEFLNDNDWTIRQKARDYLENTGWAPSDRRESTSWAIVQGRFDEAVKGGTEAIEPLINAAVYINDSEVRHWASVALSKLNSPSVVGRLRTLAETGAPEIRNAAQNCLKQLGSPIRSQPAPAQAQVTAKKTPVSSQPLGIFDAAIKMLATIGEP